MNAKHAAIVVATLMILSLASLTAASAALDNHFSKLQCASGLHPDRAGNCQPDNGAVDSRCQDGFEAVPFPNGNNYRCAPIPEGY